MNILKNKILLISLCLQFAFVVIGCKSETQNSKPEEKTEKKDISVTLSKAAAGEIELKTEIVSLQPFSGYISIPAKVLADQDAEARIGSLVPGRVHKVYVKAGDHVKSGQILMDIEGLEIGHIKADYLTDKANLEVTKANYERLKALSEQKIGSQKALLEAQADYKKAQAEFLAEDKKIHSIDMTEEEITGTYIKGMDEHSSGTLHVKSPIDGIVIERNVVIGQFVEGSTNAFRILNTTNVWVDGQANEKEINTITEKGKLLFKSSSFPGESFSGNVSFISPVIDEKTRTFTIRGVFTNQNKKLKPEMFGELLIPAAKNSKAMLVPSEAIVKIDNSDCVFITVNDSVFIKRNVVTGYSENERTEIKEGLKEGEKVVTKGAFYIKSELLKDSLGGEE